MKVKVAFGEDIRRWHYPTENRYQHLLLFVEKTFNLNGKSKKYYIQFEDGEMDKVTICNERDLVDAFECAEQENRQSLKIFITPGSLTDTHELPTGAKEETGCEFTKSTECEELNEETKKCDWKKMVVEFLLNEEVKHLLPELVRRVISVLREKKNRGEEVSLAIVVPIVLKEKTFEKIVHHQLYKNYLENLLPMLLCQASCFTHILLNLNEEAVGKWVADMLELVILSFAEGEDNGLWNTHINMWREEESNGGEAIHHRVKCDVCGMFPIRGTRYKCAVCSNYDLCGKCESSGQHCVGHPLVKMVRPMCGRNFGKHHFEGLREIGGRRHCHRRGFGRPPCWMRNAWQNMPTWGFGGNCREENKERKHCQRKRFHKWAKFDTSLDSCNAEIEQSNSSTGLECVCGATLVKTTPHEAYHHGQVVCDWCEIDCSRQPFIFHCQKNSVKHPCGFDVCLNCAAKSENDANHLPSEKLEKKENVAEKKENIENEKVEKVEIAEKVENSEKEVTEDPFDQFQYANEARSLVEMGFTEEERIMYLLVTKKGDLSQVIAELLSQ